MNLNLVHRLLKAANNENPGFLKVRGIELVREVEMMASAGLVEAGETGQGLESYSVIKRVTEAGHSFLRTFQNQPPLPEASDKTRSLADEPRLG